MRLEAAASALSPIKGIGSTIVFEDRHCCGAAGESAKVVPLGSADTDGDDEGKRPERAVASDAMLIGYARKSTKRQRWDLQLRALEAAKCDMVISEQLSGRAGIGKGLLAAIGSCRRGDTLVVWKLDRMSRNLRELLAVVDVMRMRGIRLKVLTGAGVNIDVLQTEGAAIYTVYAAFAELELGFNHERTLAGISVRQDRAPDRPSHSVQAVLQNVGKPPRNRKPLRSAFNDTGHPRLRR